MTDDEQLALRDAAARALTHVTTSSTQRVFPALPAVDARSFSQGTAAGRPTTSGSSSVAANLQRLAPLGWSWHSTCHGSLLSPSSTTSSHAETSQPFHGLAELCALAAILVRPPHWMENEGAGRVSVPSGAMCMQARLSQESAPGARAVVRPCERAPLAIERVLLPSL